MAKLATNDYLTNASTFHSLHAIARQVAPVASGGITSIDAPTFALHCLESPTGVKFFVTAKPRCEAGANAFLARVYEAYADYVLKVRERARALCCETWRQLCLPQSPPASRAHLPFLFSSRRIPFTKQTCRYASSSLTWRWTRR